MFSSSCAWVSSSTTTCSASVRILLANLRPGSSSTFSCVSFPSVFAFQEGMWDTQISALLGSPTVSGRFMPRLVPQRQRRLEGFDDTVLSLYARGLSTRDIQGHLEDLYGTQVSP